MLFVSTTEKMFTGGVRFHFYKIKKKNSTSKYFFE